ncbi:MAG: galactose-1-phosphate uridylyltransferase [Zetaproteobacteria bacterium CG_4_9_14_3_um_filter_49_83]|nr:MAG: galactose-1-phosphate uridylyltransferase [Zetaproteobacteria bacterium CG1_02_49_23]PIQ34488.1 MAG: galactose-1-phosphate uridylyltransferase [Zetaproteobacteria bacterium CG17_big_fil_post_rev_8_21_14_2_50_50_13]PIV29251.1 MAG: galactose-1-phosphate uridylyltransferase [Zetaproteobacteria bacterium CG02_land_8_20_14_3_00_50_9]PIY56085.1 MAG: galactose-1-phosphate uridylyltransferase [Zetaproteobacteria bacterium CG_4_10_14_0_8_um_filter_49_80]PJA34525.1 MAG: galactose-1-phosphate urid
MSELRLNLITGNWVVIATDRAKRPDDFVRDVEKHTSLPYEPKCPFCAGNESMTPHDIQRFPAEGPWQLRVVPNKFAALSLDTEPERHNMGRLHRMGGFGSHEVVIETPQHHQSLTDYDEAHVSNLLRIYRDRFRALYEISAIEHVIVFKNHGKAAGTSLAHPHSQIIATPVVPMQVRERMHEYMRYFDHTGECLMCSTLADELADGRRIMIESEYFVSFVPYAALSPFHLWVFPRHHQGSFAQINESQLQDLARHLQKLLRTLKAAVGDPSYNFIIRSNSPESCHREYFHWYLSIVPRVAKAAGFELGSGMFINASVPEDSAAFLREFLVQ